MLSRTRRSWWTTHALAYRGLPAMRAERTSRDENEAAEREPHRIFHSDFFFSDAPLGLLLSLIEMKVLTRKHMDD